ncbi:MAG: class I SAM-dependent methyltransferase family protein [Halobacteriales archaeon]|nr:class I SAM-dependent methyltransferase family protein [Halobacteriales archaeon]
MAVPCVRVRPQDGEATRQRLADAGLLEYAYAITVEDEWLYLPVTDPDAVPDELPVVTRELEPRDDQTMPADLLAFDPSYERLGEIAIIDEDDPDRAQRIADAIMRSDLPVETVVNRASKIKGDQRVREWDVLAGDGTETIHREYGHEFLVDIADVYFSPRLATERRRVTQQATADEQVCDMFCGVGPFVIPFAARGADVIGVDINPTAIEYLRENARRNDVADRVTAIHGDVRDIATEYAGWADRLVMNLPHSADAFLDTALELAGDDCWLHYYDIQHEDDPFGPGERAIETAAAPTYEVSVETRHRVRSYAPHELNVCLDVRLVRHEA